MKTIGLIGGTGWISTIEYYRLINQETNKRLGGSFSAKCLIHSFNFQEILLLQEKNDGDSIYSMIHNAAINLIQSGADGVALCANTMHKYADRLRSEISVPIIHIAEATARVIKQAGFSKVGLLGTKFTMEMIFYTQVLQNFGISTLVPEKADRDVINDIIYNELVNEQFKEESRATYLKIIDRLKQQGAQGIVLGCTEIPLLIQPKHTNIPLFNTLEIHARALVDFALNKKRKQIFPLYY